ncbi:hypothetical protein C5167_030771 [Papaver somniferum]|nr:hypothetical protein C5167_030771 [Papaver somniferum]
MVSVKPIHNAFVVNICDIMIVSNGVYGSTERRDHGELRPANIETIERHT